jgi:hypothetical protein
VTSVPSTQFTASDLPLLTRYVETLVLAEQAAGELRVGSLVTTDGKVNPWFQIHQQATKAMAGLALRLRLGPQSRVAKASKKSAAGPVSYYERMRLLEDTDEEDDAAQ